jgi:hypothetical protein
MKPYPLVSDLREPALRVAMPRAACLVVGQELASCPRRIKEVGLEGCPVLFFKGSGCWRHLRVPSPESINSPGVIGCYVVYPSGTLRDPIPPQRQEGLARKVPLAKRAPLR